MSPPAFVAPHYDRPADRIEPDGTQTWITRGLNFVIAVSRVEEEAVLTQDAIPDEMMILLHDAGARIEVANETIDAEPGSLTIVPPGSSRLTASGPGTVVRVFSSRVTDMTANAVNATAYAEPVPGMAPLIDGPTPIGGFRLRTYRIADYGAPGSNMRVFRSTNLMVNPLARRTEARDVTTLSPHEHEDFEQASLVLEGRYIHHIRYPWGPDLGAWRDDEHLTAGAPSVTIIPPRVIHTSRNIDGPGYLVDIFAPPRADFERRGIVCNAEDYPAHPTEDPVK